MAVAGVIPLTQGYVTKVDVEDLKRLNEYSWYPLRDKKEGTVYVITNMKCPLTGRTRTVRMHRFIMGSPPSMLVDHINHDTLDNRKENLRAVTASQNVANSQPRRGSTTEYKGVWFRSDRKRPAWVAQIKIAGRQTYLGTFSSAREAAQRYDQEHLKLSGEFADLNFPLENYL